MSIKTIYAEQELDEAATIRKFRIVRQEGARQVFLNGLFSKVNQIATVARYYHARLPYHQQPTRPATA
jgi:hypothetical protein